MKKRKQLKTEAYIQEKIKNKNKQKKDTNKHCQKLILTNC